MKENAPCNIYIFYSEQIFAFAGFNGTNQFTFISGTTTRITDSPANFRILRIYATNTARLTTLATHFVDRKKDQTITGQKTFSQGASDAPITVIN